MHSLVIFRGSERGRLPPLLHSVVFKTVTMQPDSRWFEKNAIFGLFPLFELRNWAFLPSVPPWRGEYFLKVPLACPQPCPALAKPVVFVICCVIFYLSWSKDWCLESRAVHKPECSLLGET